VSVVGVNRLACRYQDPDIVLCAPTLATLNSQEAISTIDFAIPLASPCHLDLPPNSDGQGFLLFDFLSESDTTIANRAQLSVQQAGFTCRSYNVVGVLRDDVVTTYNSGNPIMYLDVEACITDEVRRGSWGRLKMLYR